MSFHTHHYPVTDDSDSLLLAPRGELSAKPESELPALASLPLFPLPDPVGPLAEPPK